MNNSATEIAKIKIAHLTQALEKIEVLIKDRECAPETKANEQAIKNLTHHREILIEQIEMTKEYLANEPN